MIDREILIKAHEILNTDAAAESDNVQLDISQGRKVSERERQLAEVVSSLYKLIHPYMGCGNLHKDWKALFEK